MPRRRGLAAVSPARRRAIAAKGARALHKKKKAHVFTSQEATEAARIKHSMSNRECVESTREFCERNSWCGCCCGANGEHEPWCATRVRPT